MFKDCKSLISLRDISKWDTSKVDDMSNMFNECISLESLPDNQNGINLKSISYIFENCNQLASIPDISRWDTPKVTNMEGIFSKCSSLISL